MRYKNLLSSSSFSVHTTYQAQSRSIKYVKKATDASERRPERATSTLKHFRRTVLGALTAIFWPAPVLIGRTLSYVLILGCAGNNRAALQAANSQSLLGICLLRSSNLTFKIVCRPTLERNTIPVSMALVELMMWFSCDWRESRGVYQKMFCSYII